MFGLFLENGPLRVNVTGSGPDDFEIYPATQAWTDSYNVIFLDQPVNTGFSYGNTCLTSMQKGSDEFIRFLELFYEKYPEFNTRKLILTGESYAGKYLPLFTHDILKYNENLNSSAKAIPLVTTMIGDPYVSPVI